MWSEGMPRTRVKAAICRTSSGDCSRTRTLQQAPHPLQLPRSSMVSDPSRTSAARLEEPLEPPPHVVDSVRDPRERPREERLQVVALAIADHAEGDLARGTEATVGEWVPRRHPRHVDLRDRLAEASVDRVDEGVGEERVAGPRRVDAVQAEDAAQVARGEIRRAVAVQVVAARAKLIEGREYVDRRVRHAAGTIRDRYGRSASVDVRAR